LGVILSGCTVKQVVARSTTGIIQDAFAAFNEEEDLILAEGAAASNLKLLEGLLKADPNNRELLLLAARGFGGYAYAFAEEKDGDRAGRLYLRGRDYGLRLLRLDGFSTPAKLEGFQRAVKRLERGAVPAIFWTAYDWANWINLNKNSPRALADLPRVLALMQRVLDLDEKYFYGGAHVFFGSYYGGTPKIAGGDIQKAKRHFNRAVEISEGKFLTNFIFYARFFAIPAQDRKAYIQLLQRVTGAPSGILPAERLANTIARKRAVRMVDEADEYF
jgi:tetratricopeptide (TPR) repeat protein